MPSLFGGIRAPSTLGTFLRGMGHRHARQVETLAREMLVRLARHTPLLPGIDQLCFVDVDSSLHPVFGAGKQGVAFGHAKVGGYAVLLRGYNPLPATISTPDAPPVVAGTRMRGGNASSAKKAASFRHRDDRDSAPGRRHRADHRPRRLRVLRRRHGRRGPARTCRSPCGMDAKIRATIVQIDEGEWTAIRYPNAIWDDEERRWISDAQIAEVPYVAFADTKHETPGRLTVRRVRRLDNPDELFDAWRYHAAFTTTAFVLEQAEPMHRAHGVVEQVIGELKNRPAAHLPSNHFAANAAWVSLAALAHNLARAADETAAHRRPAVLRLCWSGGWVETRGLEPLTPALQT
jgi:hypothetical protein